MKSAPLVAVGGVYNERKNEDGDAGRFIEAMRNVTGRRLMYKELIGERIRLAQA